MSMDMQMRVRLGFLNLAVPPKTLARCSPACLRVELMQNKAGMLSAVWRQTLCDELCTSSATHSKQVPTARGGQVIDHTRQHRALKRRLRSDLATTFKQRDICRRQWARIH